MDIKVTVERYECTSCWHTTDHEVMTPSLTGAPTLMTCKPCGWVDER